VRLVAESRPDHATEWEAMRSVAHKLVIGSTETVRKWVRRAEVDAGARPGALKGARRIREAARGNGSAARLTLRPGPTSPTADCADLRLPRRPPGPVRGRADLPGAHRARDADPPEQLLRPPQPATVGTFGQRRRHDHGDRAGAGQRPNRRPSSTYRLRNPAFAGRPFPRGQVRRCSSSVAVMSSHLRSSGSAIWPASRRRRSSAAISAMRCRACAGVSSAVIYHGIDVAVVPERTGKMTCGGTPSAQAHGGVRRLLELEEAPMEGQRTLRRGRQWTPRRPRTSRPAGRVALRRRRRRPGHR
jgi:hypothetical protein